jgi:hypothetical protein
MRIYCRGDCICDIELKESALDFGKSVRLVCQLTNAIRVFFPKKSDCEPAKKELLCFVPKASYFFMIAPPTNTS